MANAEHLKILKEGVERWNEWRKENPEIRPDLSDANLQKADLARYDLSNANLSGADLTESNLSRAILDNADLQEAVLTNGKLLAAFLRGTNLSKANLVKTNFFDANLQKANLSDADLSEANFLSATLVDADLTDANLRLTRFSSANLTGTILQNSDLEMPKSVDSSKKNKFNSFTWGDTEPSEGLSKLPSNRTSLIGGLLGGIVEGSSSSHVYNTQREASLQFDAIFPSPFRPNAWQDLLTYVYYDHAIADVLADFERWKQNFSGEITGASSESSRPIPPDSLLTIIPDIPSVVCEPPSFQFRMTDDYHCQPFRVMHKTTPILEKLGRGRIRGAVRIYLETLVIGEIPVESEWETPGYVAPVQPTMVSSFAAQPQMMTATSGDSFKRQTAQTFRRIFASYSDADTPIVERLEKAYKALGDDYWLQFQRLRSGQDKTKVIEEAIEGSDVFQLCWSNNAKTAENVEQEWRLALARGSENFIRPIFWERPMPEPPEELRHLYFDYYQVET